MVNGMMHSITTSPRTRIGVRIDSLLNSRTLRAKTFSIELFPPSVPGCCRTPCAKRRGKACEVCSAAKLSSPSCSGSAAAASAQQPFSHSFRVRSISAAVSRKSWSWPSEMPRVSIRSASRRQSRTCAFSSAARCVGTRLFSRASAATRSLRIIPFFSSTCRMPVAVDRLSAPHVLNVALEHGAFPAVRQNVKDHPALHPGDAQVLKGGVKPRLEPVRKQVDPGAAVLSTSLPPFLSEKQIVRTRTNLLEFCRLSRGGTCLFPGTF